MGASAQPVGLCPASPSRARGYLDPGSPSWRTRSRACRKRATRSSRPRPAAGHRPMLDHRQCAAGGASPRWRSPRVFARGARLENELEACAAFDRPGRRVGGRLNGDPFRRLARRRRARASGQAEYRRWWRSADHRPPPSRTNAERSGGGTEAAAGLRISLVRLERPERTKRNIAVHAAMDRPADRASPAGRRGGHPRCDLRDGRGL